MKNKINEKQIKMSLLCVGILALGIGIGLVWNRPKTIPVLKNGDEVIAKIDGKDFAVKDLYSELKGKGGSTVLLNIIDQYIADKELKSDDEANEYAKSYLANIKAQYKSYNYDFEAALKENGYESEEDFVKDVAKDYKLTLTAQKYIKENMITNDEINEYYKNDVYGSMHAKYILITPEKKDGMTAEQTQEAEAAALAEANEVIAKLKKGEDFSDLAKKHSDDASTASQGGLYDGFVKQDVVEEFWNACTSLEDGKYTNTPVKSSYGYFVILRVNQDEKPAIEDVKEDILDELVKTKQTKDADILQKAWVKIRKSYNLSIIDTDIENKYEDLIKNYK